MPDEAVVLRRCEYVSNFTPCVAVHASVRNILRLRDVWGLSQLKSLVDARLLITELSTMESSKPSARSCYSKSSSLFSEGMSGEVPLSKGRGDPKKPWRVAEFCSS